MTGLEPSQADSFRNASPFPHLVVDDFLPPDFYADLAETFPGFDEKASLNEFGETSRKAVREKLPELGPAYARFDEVMRSADFLNRLSQVTGIPELLYDPLYVGGGTHENLEGQELDPHVDFNYHPTTRQHRRLNLILFFNDEWDAAWGGALQFHRNPWEPETDLVKTVSPKANRAVLFETSERSWHGFRKIRLPEAQKSLTRRSVAVYFYTQAPPADGAATEHSTIYVPRPLPARFKPGMTLTEADQQELEELLVRRNMQIRYQHNQLQRERENLWDVIAERDQHISVLKAELESPDGAAAAVQRALDVNDGAARYIASMQQDLKGMREVLTQVESSFSFRIGRALTWPLRLLRPNS